jgi:hypothetical protein
VKLKYVHLYFKILATGFGPKRQYTLLVKMSIVLYACQYHFSKVTIIIIINFTLCFCPKFLLPLQYIYWLIRSLSYVLRVSAVMSLKFTKIVALQTAIKSPSKIKLSVSLKIGTNYKHDQINFHFKKREF